MPTLPGRQRDADARMALDLPQQVFGAALEGEGGLAEPRHRQQLALDPTQRPAEAGPAGLRRRLCPRSEDHTSELQSLMRISYAVFCLKKKQKQMTNTPK